MDYLDKRHEFLPALCFAIGVIFILGAAYIGIGHVFTFGYAMIGVTCVFAGAFMAVVRFRLRTSQIRTRR